MTLLSRKSDYALLILWYLHQRPAGGSAREIAARFGLSRAFVANILKELCQSGLVASHRGVKGGYALLRPADQVCVAELLEALAEPLRVAACSDHGHDGDGCSAVAVCPMKGPIAELQARLYGVLKSVRLSDLFRNAMPGETLIPRETIIALAPAALAAN